MCPSWLPPSWSLFCSSTASKPLGASFPAVCPEQAAPVEHLSFLPKKPRPLLCWLPAFHISPRLPIVCGSPSCPPAFSFPHSPEISFSYVPGGVPWGWVTCHCMSFFNFFLSPCKKLSKHHHPWPCPWPQPTCGSFIPVISSRVCVCPRDWRCSGTLISSMDGVPFK